MLFLVILGFHSFKLNSNSKKHFENGTIYFIGGNIEVDNNILKWNIC
jgi:hypothetical protein